MIRGPRATTAQDTIASPADNVVTLTTASSTPPSGADRPVLMRPARERPRRPHFTLPGPDGTEPPDAA